MLKIYYDNLKISEKIILYILPIVFIYFYYINFNNNKVQYTNTKTISIYKSEVSILNEFNNLFKKYNIKLEYINSNNKYLNIKVYGKFNNLNKLINKLAYKINDYSLYLINKKLYLELSINANINVKSNKNKIIKLQNPFTKKAKKKILTKAIIGQYVYLNNKWYKLNDIYKKQKIIKINLNSIVLQKDNKEFEIKVFDDEKY